MAKPFIPLNSIRKALKHASPGDYTPESVVKTQEIVEDLVRDLARASRDIADHAGRKRITPEEIRMAARFLLKN